MTDPIVSGINEDIRQQIVSLRKMTDHYRLMSGGQHPPALYEGAPVPMPQSSLRNCIVLADRLEIIRRLPKGGHFAEVGTLYGDFAVEVLEIVKPDRMSVFDLSLRNMKSSNMEKLERAGVSFCIGDSSTELMKHAKGTFDVVYLDADHSYAGIMKDLEAALAVTKSGGLIICNDYTSWSIPQVMPYGVAQAVNGFCHLHGLQAEYLALQANGFFDIAIRC